MNRSLEKPSPSKRWKIIFLMWGGWIGVLGMCLAGPLIFLLQQSPGYIHVKKVMGASGLPFEVYERQVHSWSPVFFRELLSMELPIVQGSEPNRVITPSVVWQVGADHVTGVRWGDPRTYLTFEWNWLRERNDQLLWGQASANFAPLDADPPPEQLNPIPNFIRNQSAVELLPHSNLTEEKKEMHRSDQPRVFIYHSHNRESWLPELRGKTRPEQAYDPKINVTMLGDRLAFLLGKNGVGALSNRTDYPSANRTFQYSKSYYYSRETVQAAMNTSREFDYFFDIHRDSQGRKATTFHANGKEWAQVYFIIGKKNPNWQANMRLAKRIHNAIEKRIPGISRGVWGKGTHGNGEYNQSLSPNNVLVEVGGYANTRAECNRTLDILAEAIAEIIEEDDLKKAGKF